MFVLVGINVQRHRITYLYDLMDAAYDAHAIDAHSRSFGMFC
jgi:hypothetical protein